MSAIRVTHGSATVDLGSDDFTYTGGEVLTRYFPVDLVRAVVAALNAADFANYADAIKNGLDREGLAQ